jgi:hypothetical protein
MKINRDPSEDMHECDLRLGTTVILILHLHKAYFYYKEIKF